MTPEDDLLSPAHCVSYSLQRTARLVAGVYAEELRTCGLGRSQFPLLETLDAAGGSLATSELARRLDVDRTTLTRILGPLVSSGMVTREGDARDGRVRRVSLSGAGRGRLEEGRLAWRRAQARTLERIGPEAWRSLEQDLRRLRKALS
ncbi:MAG: MarR family winged helix-turn-helix transcriptional regulator [Phenylobacterium sp.]